MKWAKAALGNLGSDQEPTEEATQVVVTQRMTLQALLLDETTRFTVGAATTLVLLYFMLSMDDQLLRRLVAARGASRSTRLPSSRRCSSGAGYGESWGCCWRVPLLVVVKSACDRTEPPKPVGEVLCG